MVSWSRVDTFRAALREVKEGWDEDRLRLHAGEPGAIDGARWTYENRDGGLGCVRYAYFIFTLKGGKVVGIRSGGGHMRIE